MNKPLYYHSRLTVTRACGHKTTVPCVGLTPLDLTCSEVNGKELLQGSNCGKCRDLVGKDAGRAASGS